MGLPVYYSGLYIVCELSWLILEDMNFFLVISVFISTENSTLGLYSSRNERVAWVDQDTKHCGDVAHDKCQRIQMLHMTNVNGYKCCTWQMSTDTNARKWICIGKDKHFM